VGPHMSAMFGETCVCHAERTGTARTDRTESTPTQGHQPTAFETRGPLQTSDLFAKPYQALSTFLNLLSLSGPSDPSY